MWITLVSHRFVRLAIAVAFMTVTTAVHAQGPGARYDIVSNFTPAEGRPNGVIQTFSGQFYGTARLPFPPNNDGPVGVLFAMDARGARTTLHTFYFCVCPGGLTGDGVPMGNLIEGADGIVYGTSYNRNDSFIPPGQIFRISREGVYSPLVSAHSLEAGVIQASNSRLYGVFEGTIVDPSLRFYGSVFRVEANNAITIVHRFDGTESINPVGELVETLDGTLYGTTKGGALQPPPTGPPPPLVPATIFRIDPVTGAVVIRHRFPAGVTSPGRLIQAIDGRLYGTTVNGGDFGLGTVFSLDAAGTFTTLHHFSGADGSNPSAGVIQGLDGRLYGTTRNGGAFGFGTVFVMNTTGRATTLHDFAQTDGANPVDELFQANDGSFYGSAAGGPAGGGVIFRLRVPPLPAGYVEIISRNSDKCLDVSGASTEPGAPAIQWTCHGGPNQQWRLEPAGGGAVRIIARHSGQALDVSGASLDDAAAIIQWPVHGGDNQVWTLEPTSDGNLSIIVARHSGKAMDVEFGSTNDGARVIQFTSYGGTNQQWFLRPVEAIAAPVTTVSER